jgi:hypothetical protein
MIKLARIAGLVFAAGLLLTGCKPLLDQFLGNGAPVASAVIVTDTPTVDTNVEFDGSGSSDPDGDSLTYSWVVAEFPSDTASVFFSSLTAPQIILQFTEPGTYIIFLNVNDGSADSVPAKLEVWVDP